MEHAPIEETLNEPLEVPEIDELRAWNKSLQIQLDFAKIHNRNLRVKLNRLEAILGMEEAA